MVLIEDYKDKDNDRYTTRIYTTPKSRSGLVFVEFLNKVSFIPFIISFILIIAPKSTLQIQNSMMLILCGFPFSLFMLFISMKLHNKYINAQSVRYNRKTVDFFDNTLDGNLLCSLNINSLEYEVAGLTLSVKDNTKEYSITCHDKSECHNLISYLYMAIDDTVPVTGRH